MFQKDMRVSLLLDFYGELLSERRREIMEMYFNEDFSLSEIADETGISRQGVRDSVKKGENELSAFEDKLGLVKRFARIRGEVDKIKVELEELSCCADESTKVSLLKLSKALASLDV